MNELYERQLRLQQRLSERDRLARKLKTFDKQITEHETVRKQLLNTFTKEQRDVYDLETFSLVNAWRKLRGTFNEQRTIELEEAARAELKLREHEAMIDELVLERRDLYETLEAYNRIDAKWEAFMKEKEVHLKQDPNVREELYLLTKQQVETNEVLVEYEEAIVAGQSARTAISKTLKHLGSAKGWSTYDTFFGGGLIATALKHDAIDTSERKMHELQSALERFSRELTDVKGVVSGLHIERGSLVQFADYFLDDIFSEWTMHGRITDSLDKVNGLDREITNLIEKMMGDVERLERRLEDTEEKRRQLIVTR